MTKPSKIIHCSDFHLGKKLFNHSRLSEQEAFLSYILEYLKKNDINYFIIAGDIFDTPRPGHQEISLFYSFLAKLQLIDNLKTLVIGGNHDSGKFIDAPRSLIDPKKIIIRGRLKTKSIKDLESHLIIDESIGFCLIPYFRRYDIEQIKILLDLDPLAQPIQVLENLINFYSSLLKNVQHKFLIAHHLFGQYSLTGSEQNISITGIESIPVKLFHNKFDYLALGHIHKFLKISPHSPVAIYPGSPIPYRFSESNKKSMVQISCYQNKLDFEKISIPSFRKLFKIVYTSLEKLKSDLNDLDHGPLPSFIELTLDKSLLSSQLIEEIEENMQDNEAKIIKFSVKKDKYNNLKTNKLSKTEVQIGEIPSTIDFFKEFISNKSSNDQNIMKTQDKIIKDFQNLLVETNEILSGYEGSVSSNISSSISNDIKLDIKEFEQKINETNNQIEGKS